MSTSPATTNIATSRAESFYRNSFRFLLPSCTVFAGCGHCFLLPPRSGLRLWGSRRAAVGELAGAAVEACEDMGKEEVQGAGHGHGGDDGGAEVERRRRRTLARGGGSDLHGGRGRWSGIDGNPGCRGVRMEGRFGGARGIFSLLVGNDGNEVGKKMMENDVYRQLCGIN
ncbi:hypothetical protein TRIUR3_24960 [Triticum urartu]|uniref:Uncharacterized protein n=1 Tax=Triticum urartu TaxID=4572 RepID=M7YS21_TRIUA|nr:hypothetical protein TRIUR3_24960 [Triticum urartu]